MSVAAIFRWAEGRQIAEIRPAWRRHATWVASLPAYIFFVLFEIAVFACKYLWSAAKTSANSWNGIAQQEPAETSEAQS
jgi:hypothetical protein